MAETIFNIIASQGYIGVFVLMVLENVFPPIPSEVILPFVGLSIANGTLSAVPALAAATAGSVVGTTLWFLLGRLVSVERLRRFFSCYGAYVAISAEDFESASQMFKRYQIPAVFFGRMIPTVRSVISIPAGTVHMKLAPFLFLTTLGSALWNALLMYCGYVLYQDFAAIEVYIDPVANGVILLFLFSYLAQIARFHWRRHRIRRASAGR